MIVKIDNHITANKGSAAGQTEVSKMAQLLTTYASTPSTGKSSAAARESSQWPSGTVEFQACTTLQTGQEAIIREIVGTDTERERLIACGLEPGAKVRVVRRGPFGGAFQLAVRNVHIALPLIDAARILVQS